MAPGPGAAVGHRRWRPERFVPDRASLRRAARVALAGSPGFVVAVVVADDLQFGLFAMIGPVCLGAIAVLAGPPRRQVRDTLSAGVVAGGLVALGTVVSDTTAIAAGLTFVVAFAASFAAVVGRRVVSVTTALTLLFVVASSVPAPTAAIGPRLAGLAVGVVALALLELLIPDREQHAFRAVLAQALEALAVVARRIATGASSADGAAAATRTARAVGLRAHPYLAPAGQRPVGAGRVERAERLLVDDADRLADDLAELETLVEAPAGRLHPPGREVLGEVADSLARSAAALAGGEGGQPAAEHNDHAGSESGAGAPVGGGSAPAGARAPFAGDRPLDARVDRYVADLRARLARDLRGGMGADVLAIRCRRAMTLAVAGRIGSVVAAHARIALGGVVDGPVPGFADPSPRAAWVRRLQANLTPSSVLMRTSLRIGLGLAAARALVGVLDLQHGFWVVFATLSVLRTTPGRTGATALQALAGTVLGALVAAALVLILKTDATAYAVVLPFAVFVGVAAAGVGLVAGQAAFTVMIVVLFNLAKPGAWELPLLRVEDVAIGAATGIAIGLAIWPRGARGQVCSALAELVRSAAALASEVARGALGEGRENGARGGDTAPGEHRDEAAQATRAEDDGALEAGSTVRGDRAAAARATIRADDIFTTFLAETGDRDRALDLWAALLSDAHALRALSTLLPPPRVAVPTAGAPAELAVVLARSASRLAVDGQRAADALVALAPPGTALVDGASPLDGEARDAERRSVAAAKGHDTAGVVVDLFLLRRWIERADESLARIDGLIANAARAGGRPRSG
jgi:uncharacterized membrane protein YccC